MLSIRHLLQMFDLVCCGILVVDCPKQRKCHKIWLTDVTCMWGIADLNNLNAISSLHCQRVLSKIESQMFQVQFKIIIQPTHPAIDKWAFKEGLSENYQV